MTDQDQREVASAAIDYLQGPWATEIFDVGIKRWFPIERHSTGEFTTGAKGEFSGTVRPDAPDLDSSEDPVSLEVSGSVREDWIHLDVGGVYRFR